MKILPAPSIPQWIEDLLPGAEVTRTAAGHFLQEEAPEEIAEAVRRVAAELTSQHY